MLFRMMEVSKGFGRCIKNHCDNPRRQTVYPRDEKSTQCLPVQGDLSACETELFISAGTGYSLNIVFFRRF